MSNNEQLSHFGLNIAVMVLNNVGALIITQFNAKQESLMKKRIEAKQLIKRITYASAVALLLAIGTHGNAQAYTISTVYSELPVEDLRRNLNNTSSNDADVTSHDGYLGTLHTSSEWNHLGRSNTVNDGVRWSVDGGTFGNNTILATGQFSIRFAVDLWSAGYGEHNYDQAKAWVDWNNNEKFDNDNLLNPSNSRYVADETILAGQYFKKNSDSSNSKYNRYSEDDQVMPDPSTINGKISKNDLSDTMTTFITDAFTVTEQMLNTLTLGNFDGFWLRARSQCNHVTYNNMDPYSELYQGEAEDYLINIVDARAPVPEPATMLLFGSGILGLAAVRRRNKK